MKKVFDSAARTVEFRFDDGLPPVIVDAMKLSPEMSRYAVLFAIGHRCGDNAAIQKSADNGYKVTEAMRREAVIEMADHMQAGGTDWDLTKGPRKPAINPALVAMAQRLGITYEEAATRDVGAMLDDIMNLPTA